MPRGSPFLLPSQDLAVACSLLAFIKLIPSPDRTTDQCVPASAGACPPPLPRGPVCPLLPPTAISPNPGQKGPVKGVRGGEGACGWPGPGLWKGGCGGHMKTKHWRKIYCTIKKEWAALGTIKATLLWNYRGRLGNEPHPRQPEAPGPRNVGHSCAAGPGSCLVPKPP